ncbi:HemP domain containing protein [Sulfitobacter donghicola DSW-25 = KCTC 12864 = JCM 14565]|nr:hemin uptake protein HemP [Sulfitobacter donghicola]KIN69615.1 HemP domain containing protein [Sulfitobacter donghicola DSW-25 = KCTC 12864 = JCM 14565]
MPTYDVRDIVQKDGQARLVLDEAVYTLRITRAGKLILTK